MERLTESGRREQDGSDGAAWLKDAGRRRRSSRDVLALWGTAAGTLGAGLVLFYAFEDGMRMNEDLSFVLEEMPAASTGIDFVHEKAVFSPFFDNVKPFMQAVSASTCVADFDRDGLLDVYFTTSGLGRKNRLYRNQGGFRFAPMEVPAIEDLNQDGFSTDCLFADVDNDGYDDLVVGMVGQRVRLFLNRSVDNGPERGFTDFTEGSGIDEYMNGFAVAFVDVENDGDIDFLMASYFATHYQPEDVPGAPRVHPWRVPPVPGAGRLMPNSWANATNGGTKSLYLNDGRGVFVKQDLRRWGLAETRFTFDIGTADLNRDGWTDLYFANDFGPDQLYWNREGQAFEPVKSRVPTGVGRDSFKGMNAEIADTDGDGYPEIFVSNVFHPILPEGSLLWSNRPSPSGDGFRRDFTNIAAEVGVKDGGWGWGAKFVDLDLDGDRDLIATNGFVSQNPDRDYWFRMSRLAAGHRSLIADSVRWPPFEDASMSGFETTRVFVNDGVRFWDRAAEAGIRRPFDGRGVAFADFDADGRADVLVAIQGGAPYVAKNRYVSKDSAATPPPSFVGVRLRGDGERVNAKAVGTRVRITPSFPGDPDAFPAVYFEVDAGNGMSAQSMNWILAGLGRYRREVDVEVRWTDGTTLVEKRLPPNEYHAIEYASRGDLHSEVLR